MKPLKSMPRTLPVDSDLARKVLFEVFRLSPYGLGVLDAQARFVMANDVLDSWLSGTAEAKAESLFEDCEVLRRLVFRAQSAGSAREADTTAVDGQGRRFSVSVTLASLDPPLEHGANFLLIMEDITEKKAYSQQLLRTEKLASLGTMAGGVAHDFNNILMTILGNTQLLHKELSKADPQVRRRLQNIEKAVLDGAHVVRRLQVFTGKDSGVSKSEEKTLIHEAVHDVLELTRPRWKNALEKQGRRVEIVKELSSNACAAINAADFREVLTNLVFNAIDAMPHGGVLRFRSYEEEDQVVLEVTDTGVGMDEPTQKRIFDPFFTTKGACNSGLGLSVCAGLIQRWSGHLGVRSAPGKGTTVTLRLPAARTQACRPAIPKAGPVQSMRKRLLVVDDDREVLELLGDMLRLMGHTVTALHDPRRALEMLVAQPFDLVLTDLGMPDVNGWEVAACAKKHQPKVPVILVSGWGSQYEDEDLKDRGVDFVCSKPLSYQKLLEIMARFAS
ncbi:hybrid sensor histidine kinase/response regulator [Desulfosoma caldarium]|nr:ATP-binding protein [Desulfosoma caldarium]